MREASPRAAPVRRGNAIRMSRPHHGPYKDQAAMEPIHVTSPRMSAQSLDTESPLLTAPLDRALQDHGPPATAGSRRGAAGSSPRDLAHRSADRPRGPRNESPFLGKGEAPGRAREGPQVQRLAPPRRTLTGGARLVQGL